MRGEICARCGRFLPEPFSGRETICVFCQPTVRVYMYFQLASGWQVSFLHMDMKTPAAPPRTFTDARKIEELARRGGGLQDLASRQALEQAILKGRGGIDLHLTPEQYERLRQQPKPPSKVNANAPNYTKRVQ